MYRISAIWMNQMPCSITSIARTVGSRAPADFGDEATLQATQPDAACSFDILMYLQRIAWCICQGTALFSGRRKHWKASLKAVMPGTALRFQTADAPVMTHCQNI